jgi:hypothetical protein
VVAIERVPFGRPGAQLTGNFDDRPAGGRSAVGVTECRDRAGSDASTTRVHFPQ